MLLLPASLQCSYLLRLHARVNLPRGPSSKQLACKRSNHVTVNMLGRLDMYPACLLMYLVQL
jgi:hypothetical protein